MSTVNTTVTTFTSLAIAIAVVLSGTHAKDFATLTLLDTKKVDDTSQHIVKVAVGELHSHVDKTVKIQTASDSGHQADTRSLRLLHDKKEAFRGRITDRLRFWWQMNTLYLS